MVNIQSNNTILTYKVGPVFCCSPCSTIISVTQPTPLTKLPGQNSKHTGIFKFGSKLVTVCELRIIFGAASQYWNNPGRLIITELKNGNIGFWVDSIIDVMEAPQTGWDKPPKLIPKEIFNKVLIYNNTIYLYADFEKLLAIKQAGYLKNYIDFLNQSNIKNDTKNIELINSNTILNNSNNTLTSSNNNVTVNPINSETRKKSTKSDSQANQSQLEKKSKNSKIIFNKKHKSIQNEFVRKTHNPIIEKPNIIIPAPAPQKANIENFNIISKPNKSNFIDILVLSVILISLVFAGYILANLNNEKESVPITLEPATLVAPQTKLTREITPNTAVTVKFPVKIPPHSATIIKNNQNVIITLKTPISPKAFESLEKEKDLLNNRNLKYLSDIENSDLNKSLKQSPLNSNGKSILTSEIIHIVVKGDTLWDIAKFYVNNPYQFPELARLNRIKNPDLIYPGNKVHLIQIYIKNDN